MNGWRIFRAGLMVGGRDFSMFWTWKTWLTGWMLRITTNVFVWVLMGRMLGSPATLHYLLVGFAATAGVGTFAVSAGSWDRFDGTYLLLVIAPGSVAPALMGRTAIWVFGWIASALLTLAIVAFAFSWTLSLEAWLAVVAIVVVLCLSAFCLTVFLGAVAALVPRLRNMFNVVLLIVFSAFCGVSVPITFWPTWLQIIINLLPVTHGLAAIRLVADCGPAGAIGRQVSFEVCTGLGWLALALLVVDRFAEAGRVNGTIDES
jgi:ABC-2 type transport system permease protein